MRNCLALNMSSEDGSIPPTGTPTNSSNTSIPMLNVETANGTASNTTIATPKLEGTDNVNNTTGVMIGQGDANTTTPAAVANMSAGVATTTPASSASTHLPTLNDSSANPPTSKANSTHPPTSKDNSTNLPTSKGNDTHLPNDTSLTTQSTAQEISSPAAGINASITTQGNQTSVNQTGVAGNGSDAVTPEQASVVTSSSTHEAGGSITAETNGSSSPTTGPTIQETAPQSESGFGTKVAIGVTVPLIVIAAILVVVIWKKR